MDSTDLLFRRQFILAPKELTSFRKWKNDKLSNGYHVSVHPDLQYLRVQRGDDFIICLGYILDPLNPSWSDSDIINQFFRLFKTKNELFDYLNTKGGRYVIIGYLKKEFFILNDPAGFRQVFYMFDSSSDLWCASQPVIIAEMFGLSSDIEVEKDLLSIPLFNRTNEYWYPGQLTAYREIKHLIPNHYLNINSGKQIRFWPEETIGKIDIDEGLEITSVLLRGIMESACRRFKMALAITSGLDSRILLAACKDVCKSINYITHTRPGLDTNCNDIRLPSVMLKELGLKHEIIGHSEIIDPDFEKFFRRNVTMARKTKGLNAYAIFRYLKTVKTEMMVANGVCGEITRHFYFLPKVISINGKSLAALAGMSGSEIAVEQFEKWLSESNEISKTGISLLDLFYWEQRLGNWAAMSYSEYDIAFDSFSPMNCRKLIQCMLETDNKFRKPPKYMFHKMLIEKMWPQTAEFSINPSDNMVSAIKTRIKRTTLHHIYKTIKYIPHSTLFNKAGVRYGNCDNDRIIS